MRIGLAIGLLTGLIVAFAGSAAMAQDVVQSPPGPPAAPIYAERGALTCMKCHDGPPVTDILRTPHAVKADPHAPFAQYACETCHGASPEHLNSHPAPGQMRALPAVVFKGPGTAPVEVRNQVCLTCHQAGLRMNWQGSQHQKNDLACNSCHTIHAPKDPILVKLTQPTKCFTCHNEQRAQSFEFSHHPIREGKVVCSDCHNPHGSPGPKLLKEFTLNEVCYTCHAEKRGPLLWEHQPVRESCLNCHTPHGSTQARLLIQRPPFLCQNCHETGNHNAAPWTGNQVPGVSSPYNNSPLTAPSGSHFQVLLRGCLNCHSQVHGSNSPAGAFLTR